jgi:hypothetical protein
MIRIPWFYWRQQRRLSEFGPLFVQSWHGYYNDKESLNLDEAKALYFVSYKPYTLKPRVNYCKLIYVC